MTDPSTKKTLRAKARQRRAALQPSGAAKAAAAQAVDAVLAFGGPIALYVAIGDELDPAPLARLLAAAGADLTLPRVERRDAAPVFRAWAPGDELTPDLARVPAPLADAPERPPRVLITPLLAFDREGGRLGYGGGYYDRAIGEARARGPALVIGYAYAAQEIDAAPMEPHDARLDAVATERDFILCRRSTQ